MNNKKRAHGGLSSTIARSVLDCQPAMPPRTKKRLGYNWKARQNTRQQAEGVLDSNASSKPRERIRTTGQDTNALLLPAHRKRSAEVGGETDVKRKRLNAKQRKRLVKILETKKKKAKHAVLLSNLSQLALPQSHMDQLCSSTSLSCPRPNHRQLISQMQVFDRNKRRGEGGIGGGRGEGGGRVGYSDELSTPAMAGMLWRGRRKRRQRRRIKAEKDLIPLEKTQGPGGNVSQVYSPSSGEEEQAEEETVMETEGEVARKEIEEEKGRGEQKGEEEEEEDSKKAVVSRIERNSSEKESVGTKEVKNIIFHAHQPTVFIPLSRPADVQKSRVLLPIASQEYVIMEAMAASSVVVLCGETGSGKTTQLPQFLYEAGYTSEAGPCGRGIIAVTQPRRVAAVTMATRVAYETGLHRQVSYQIRYHSTVNEDTVIKFMTDGVLLRQIEKDFLLSSYTVVVVDEAHERTVYTDLLLGFLSRIVVLREKSGCPLKLVVMSATLRVEDFTENHRLFPSPPPVITVESRQFPVSVHFNKSTPVDYLRETYRKVCQVHRRLPPGQLLVFLTGQREVLWLCRALQDTFPGGEGRGERGAHFQTRRSGRRGRGMRREEREAREDLNLDSYPVLPPSPRPELRVRSEEEEEEGEEEGEEKEEEEEREKMEWGGLVSCHDKHLPLTVLPLYSLLPSERQAEVFRPVPEGVRLCVVATNIAETSITIPNIKYVVDCGKVKRRYYDRVTGVSSLRVEWVSKASANQRAGRAGRTEPGHCYRLYSSAVFHHHFPQFSDPEVCRRPVTDVLLQLKALGIDRVHNFPFPTAPPAEALLEAEKTLIRLGALSPSPSSSSSPSSSISSSSSTSSSLTALGRTMARFPVAPCYARMLAVAGQHGCLPYMVAIVAALTVQDLFVESDQSLRDEERGRAELRRLSSLRRSWAGEGEFYLLGDVMLLLRAVGAWSFTGGRDEFCRRNGLRPRAMQEVIKLRQQFTNTVNAVSSEANLTLDPQLPPPTEQQAKYLRQIILSGLGDHVARKISTKLMNTEDKKRLQYSYECFLCDGPVSLSPSSIFWSAPPDYVVFQEVVEVNNKISMRGVVMVEEEWLPLILPQFCSFSSPLENPPIFYSATGSIKCHMKCTYGPHGWPLPVQERPFPHNLQCYNHFAMFLLQGKVAPQLGQFSSSLLLPPVTMIRKWAKLHPQAYVLQCALVERKVCCWKDLQEEWKREPKYLLKAFSMWLPQAKHRLLAQLWPPIG